jgi:hypothetical protein
MIPSGIRITDGTWAGDTADGMPGGTVHGIMADGMTLGMLTDGGILIGVVTMADIMETTGADIMVTGIIGTEETITLENKILPEITGADLTLFLMVQIIQSAHRPLEEIIPVILPLLAGAVPQLLRIIQHVNQGTVIRLTPMYPQEVQEFPNRGITKLC